MKNFMRFLCAAMLLVSFTACDEKDNENDNPGGGDNNSTLATQLVGTWQSEHIYINDEEVQMQMTIVMNADGTGELAGMSETINWQVNGNDVNVTNQHGNTFTFTVTDITETYMIITGNTIPGSDQQAKFEGKFLKANGGTPDTPDPGDLGIGTPELVSSTETSLTLSAHVTGTVGEYLSQFPNYSCGFICSYNSVPTMNDNMTVGNPDMNGNFEATISGLEEGKDYLVCAWLKLTPESEPMISEYRVYATDNGSDPDDPNWVNLGLPSGLLWATCNVGATVPEDTSSFFAWGETVAKTVYECGWDIYAYGSNYTQLTKYCNDAYYGVNGYTDNLTILEPGDDAATVNLGNGARTPTKEEWQELIGNITAEWMQLNGINGCRLTAANGNSIFLPAAGDRNDAHINHSGSFGYYWSASLDTEDPYRAWCSILSSSNQLVGSITRCNGLSVRAVKSAK